MKCLLSLTVVCLLSCSDSKTQSVAEASLPAEPVGVSGTKTADAVESDGTVADAGITGAQDVDTASTDASVVDATRVVGPDASERGRADTPAVDVIAVDTVAMDTEAGTDAVSIDALTVDDTGTALLPDGATNAADDVSADTFEEDVVASPDALGTQEPDGPVVILDTEFPIDSTGFSLGVSAGAARHDSIMFWTKYSGSDEVTLKVWRPLDIPEQVVLAYDSVVVPNDGGFIKVRVDGLVADKLYYYAFFIESQRSPLGIVRTALGPGEKRPITVAASSCTSGFYQPWPSLSLMAEYDIDAILHVGDMSYNDGAVTLEDYRAEWANTLSQAGYRDLFSSGGLYATWDDHEVDNDWDPETMDAANVAAAKQAFFETLPNDEGPESRLWDSYTWGDALEIFILDCRSERKPSTIESSSEPDIYVSLEQMAWLKEGLVSSTATFKVILNSVPITDMPFFYFGEQDRWEGYSDQRTELLSYIFDNDISGVWFIAGDFHLGFVSWVENSGPGENLREIAVGPGGNLNPAGLLSGLFPSWQFDFFHGNPETATLITFDPEAETVFIQFIDAWDGDVLLAQEYPGVLAP
jgi:alkaline phosphatase D